MLTFIFLFFRVSIPIFLFESQSIFRGSLTKKVGTLDQLVGLSDDLGKLDAYVETITRKVATYLGEVLEDQRDKLQENLLANNSK